MPESKRHSLSPTSRRVTATAPHFTAFPFPFLPPPNLLIVPPPPNPPNLLIVPPPPNPPQPPGTFWASSVAGVLAYQWSKPIPTNLKIIHARVAAQALTLGALAAAAAVDFYEHKAELERVGVRLEDVEKKVQKVHGAEK